MTDRLSPAELLRRYIRISDATRVYSVSRQRIYQLIDEGTVERARWAGGAYVLRDDMDRWRDGRSRVKPCQAWRQIRPRQK